MISALEVRDEHRQWNTGNHMMKKELCFSKMLLLILTDNCTANQKLQMIFDVLSSSE